MPLPSSGPLSLNAIQTEFGGTNPISLNEYYAGGGLVPAGTSGTNGAVPSSGQIAISNFYGTSKIARGCTIYIGSGIRTWVAPANVTSISYVIIGQGGPGGAAFQCGCFCSCPPIVFTIGGYGGGGGGLVYRNNLTVSPGASYNVVMPSAPNNNNYFNSTSCGYAGNGTEYSRGASGNGTANYFGGCGGVGTIASKFSGYAAGGGGAAGYSGNGGQGGCGQGGGQTGFGGGGGGGGGASIANSAGFGGGGVGIYGLGSSGSGGAVGNNGLGGSGGSSGSGGGGGAYGGGSGGCSFGASNSAMRIIWPGNTRSFPSTDVGA